MLVTNPLAPRPWARDAVRSVSSGWWVLLISGIASIIAGGLMLLIDWTVSDLAVFVGVLFVVRGVFTMFSLPLDGRMWGGRSPWECWRSASVWRCGSGPNRRSWSSPPSSN
jgi:uncharacterized membrane protein HdeD (DUF308 family)